MTNYDRTKSNPWVLKTPPGTSDYTMHVEEKDGRSVLVCTVGKTVLFYDLRCIDDLHAMLKGAGDWVELGGADEQKPAKEGTVEAWARSPTNPAGGWVRTQERAARTIRRLYSPAHGGPRSVRARAPSQEQSHAGEVTGQTAGSIMPGRRARSAAASGADSGAARPSAGDALCVDAVADALARRRV